MDEQKKRVLLDKIEHQKKTLHELTHDIGDLQQRIQDHDEKLFRWWPSRKRAHEYDLRQLEILQYQASRTKELLQDLEEKIQTS